MEKQKPEIEQTIIKGKDDEIISYSAKRTVKKFGAGTGHITLPFSLIGKYVYVSYSKTEGILK